MYIEKLNALTLERVNIAQKKLFKGRDSSSRKVSICGEDEMLKSVSASRERKSS